MIRNIILPSVPRQCPETQRSFMHVPKERDAVTSRVRMALLCCTEVKRPIWFLCTNSFRNWYNERLYTQVYKQGIKSFMKHFTGLNMNFKWDFGRNALLAQSRTVWRRTSAHRREAQRKDSAVFIKTLKYAKPLPQCLHLPCKSDDAMFTYHKTMTWFRDGVEKW